ncbi:N-alpha-acetyltransferase 38-A, NatC auxiliary subunit isoform X1 [Procambarus clarkii]|uniref:N-alpha-acetyltransferase 38-A, NatC auxiliary subunit isoform X1 n=1 Tax=Procambarus clarkii TaxID=6728 RepID=UPI001E673C6A|nr:N-alpha-acetyltransferase 38-A, NatC auxiliary subunit-like isoform X1 [Procambarus clarkii]XP_045612502.1 N-alpha-acetyltransferase 38-A, NatC auxiliary subunit-like isoform X1 [Procambarus clarkii]
MKTGGDFRDHLVDLTDGGTRSGDSSTDKQPQRKNTPGRMRLEKWLHSSMKIEMTDGRTLVGSFVCTDRDNNIILGSCTEHLRPDEKVRECWSSHSLPVSVNQAHLGCYWHTGPADATRFRSHAASQMCLQFEDGREEEPRVLGLAMIPGRHIVSICIDEASQPPQPPTSLYT